MSPTANTSLLWLIIPVALGNFYQAATFSQTQGVVELKMRSVAAAILLFIINIIGLGFGPSAVGIVSDILQSEYGKESLRYSLLIFVSFSQSLSTSLGSISVKKFKNLFTSLSSVFLQNCQ